MDASALRADEGRGIAAISVGERRARVDPTISEWGNPLACGPAPSATAGTGGTETSHVPRGTESIPVVAASEPGAAQTVSVSSRQALRRRGCKTTLGGLPSTRGCEWGSEDVWKASPQTVTAEYESPTAHHAWFLSSAGHEQSGVKRGGPPPKATYTQRPIAQSTVRER